MGGSRRTREQRRVGAATIKVAAAVLGLATVVVLGLLFCRARKNTPSAARYRGTVIGRGWAGQQQGGGGRGVLRLSSPSYYYAAAARGEKSNNIVFSAALPEASRHGHGYLRGTQLSVQGGEEGKNSRSRMLPAFRASDGASKGDGTKPQMKEEEEKEEGGVSSAKAPRTKPTRSFLGLLFEVVGFFCGMSGDKYAAAGRYRE